MASSLWTPRLGGLKISPLFIFCMSAMDLTRNYTSWNSAHTSADEIACCLRISNGPFDIATRCLGSRIGRRHAADPGHYFVEYAKTPETIRQTHRMFKRGNNAVRGHVFGNREVPAPLSTTPDGPLEESHPTRHFRFHSPRCYAACRPHRCQTVASRSMAAWVSPGKTIFTCSTVCEGIGQHSEMPRFIASASPRWLSILAAHLRRARRLHLLAREALYDRSSAIHKRQRNCRHHHQHPPVNALSPGVPEGISEALDQIAQGRQRQSRGPDRRRPYVCRRRATLRIARWRRASRAAAGLLRLLLKIEDSSSR